MPQTNELSLDRIRALFDLFRKANPYPQWFPSFKGDIAWVQKLDDAALRLPENQEKLWRVRGISGIGPGEAITPKGAYADPQVADAFVQTRALRLPDEPGARSRALQDAYNRVLSLVHPKHTSIRPQAKLARAFTAMFPRDTHTCYSHESARNVVWLVLGNRSVNLVEGMVLIRQRLRGALGAEADVDDDVRRAMFCWWLHEHYDVVARGEDPPAPSGTVVAPKVEPLVLWPVAKQRRGLTAINGYLETWRAVVNSARNGATPDDIVTTLRTTYNLTSLSPKTCRSLFNEVRNFEFVTAKDGLWHPSEDGLRLVEEDPPDIMVERVLVRAWGVAQVIRDLKSGPLTRGEQVAKLRARYPIWTSDWAPSAQAGWAQALGLMGVEPDGRRYLTEYGATWEARLPAELPDPPIGNPAPAPTPATETAKPVVPWPSYDALLAQLRTDHPGFVLDEDQLRCLHVAWHCNDRKRFTLLSGLSGTGKTALLRNYANTYVSLCKLVPDEQIAIVSVSPDWRDPTGLLGYFNPLHADHTWHRERALKLLLDAEKHPERPYFLVLDEMNLAHVEKYFAPFLSAMETGEPLALHDEEDDVNDVPRSVTWPKNLFIGGTLNMDETTHPISDKVLDRAFTLEFWDVDLASYLNARDLPADLRDLLLDLHGILARVRRHFGYRTAGEVLAFVQHADASAALLDQAVFAKVLPKLRGEDSPEFRKALLDARARCEQAELKRCARKLAEMHDRLVQTGVVRFWA